MNDDELKTFIKILVPAVFLTGLIFCVTISYVYLRDLNTSRESPVWVFASLFLIGIISVLVSGYVMKYRWKWF